MNETEIRELLKLIRGIEHYLERALRTEQEKNEGRLKEQLTAQGIEIDETDKTEDWNEFPL